jgi:hypothetical protein
MIDLKAEPDGADAHGREPVIRLRMLLKAALRRYGFRCTHIRETADDAGRSESRGDAA